MKVQDFAPDVGQMGILLDDLMTRVAAARNAAQGEDKTRLRRLGNALDKMAFQVGEAMREVF